MWVVVQTTVHVFRSLYSYRFPLPETETLFVSMTFADEAIYRDAFIFQRPLDSVVLIGEIKYRLKPNLHDATCCIGVFNQTYTPPKIGILMTGSYQELLSSLIVAAGRLFEPICN